MRGDATPEQMRSLLNYLDARHGRLEELARTADIGEQHEKYATLKANASIDATRARYREWADLYTKGGVTMQEVANRFGVGYQTVQKAMSVLGVKVKRTGPYTADFSHKDRLEAVARYNKGEKWVDICKDYGMNAGRLRTLCKKLITKR